MKGSSALCALGEIGIDQPLDGVGHLVGDEAVAEDVADRGVSRWRRRRR